jgi:hypothetical protein
VAEVEVEVEVVEAAEGVVEGVGMAAAVAVA